MVDNESIAIEADWLPPAELERLLNQQRTEFPEVSFSVEPPDHRSIETALAVALGGWVTGRGIESTESAGADRLSRVRQRCGRQP